MKIYENVKVRLILDFIKTNTEIMEIHKQL